MCKLEFGVTNILLNSTCSQLWSLELPNCWHAIPYYILMNGNGTQILRLDQYLIDRGRVQADGQGRQSGGGSIGAAWALGGVT